MIRKRLPLFSTMYNNLSLSLGDNITLRMCLHRMIDALLTTSQDGNFHIYTSSCDLPYVPLLMPHDTWDYIVATQNAVWPQVHLFAMSPAHISHTLVCLIRINFSSRTCSSFLRSCSFSFRSSAISSRQTDVAPFPFSMEISLSSCVS